jgi:predicted nuclease with TOPRIM domain
MESIPPQTNRKTELANKIKILEEEKVHLQREIVRLKEMLTTSQLEKKAKQLESEVSQLRTLKGRLQNKMPNKSETDSATVTVPNLKQPAVRQTDNQNSPVKYGTWSKLQVS